MNSANSQAQDLTLSHTLSEQNPFTFDQLKMIWKQLAFYMKEKGLENVYFALNKRDPKLFNDINVHFECDNQVQIDIIQTNITEIVEFIRKGLKNYSIQLQFKVNSNPEENVRLLTSKDKFLALTNKNPNLFSLQKTFNLDIDL